MSTPSGGEQIPLSQTAGDIYVSVEDFLATVEDRVAQYAINGATQDQIEELGIVKDKIHLMGEMATRSVAVMDETEIPVLPETEPVDEEAAYSLVRSFITDKGYGTPFSTRELREHLSESGIQIDAKQFGRWFANWRDEIESEARLSGARVRFERIPKELGMERGSYALAQIVGPKDIATDDPAKSVAPVPTNLHLSSEADRLATERATATILRFVRENPTVKANSLLPIIAAELHISVVDTDRIINELVASAESGLYKVRREGSSYYSDVLPEKRKPNANESFKQEEVLSEQDEKIALGMLEAFARYKVTEYEQGMTAREIERYILLRDETIGLIGSRRINRIARVLGATGVIKSWQARKGQGGSQFRIGASDRQQHITLKNRGNWDAIIAAAKSGEHFERPTEE